MINGTVMNEVTELRIINGAKATFAIPWIVRLAIKKNGNRESICTGFIISARLIMTAAHCLCHVKIIMSLEAPLIGFSLAGGRVLYGHIFAKCAPG